jgi:SHS2 domain-containing protein
MITEAILKINPNADVVIRGSDLNTCTIEWLNGTVEISKADIQAKITELETEIEQEKQDAITKKASGKQKLLDLGLSEEEVKALIGV